MWMTSPEPLSSTLLNHQTRKVQNSRLGPPSSGTLYRTFHISPAHGSAPVRFGARDDLTLTLAGGLDEVAIYPRVLTADEILENYTTGAEA